jgi:glycosyltransferase involved in cell wall biosynthesis
MKELTMMQKLLPDLVVICHLRWAWVWQRPQHLVSRFAGWRAASGARTWFVEEPRVENVESPQLRTQDVDGITRVWLALPPHPELPDNLGFDARGAELYGDLLLDLFARAGRPLRPDVLLYTPLALDAARTLNPDVLAYDVMDDLAAFRNAAEGLRLAQRRLLAAADVVFAGGRSLHESVRRQGARGAHLFPSGVDCRHYATSREQRVRRAADARPVAGYVGVIDERIDLSLIAGLADELPDWTVRIVGPVAKIDPESLPQRPNIEYPGMAEYAELPRIMAEFDVAIMPFALNEATRSISPTKTLEYLAAGLPVVSTRVADVVADYSGIVCLSDSAAQFAAACRSVVDDSMEERDTKLGPILARYDWEAISAQMYALIQEGRTDYAHTGEVGTASTASTLAADLEFAHGSAAAAAAAGLQDSALGGLRLAGSAVATLADAAVSSATPYLRAPLLARMSAVMLLHPLSGDENGRCATCGTPAPCATAEALKW